MNRYSPLLRVMPYGISFLVPLTAVLGLMGRGYYTFLTIVIILGVVPVLELLLKNNGGNVPQPLEEEYKKSKSFTAFLLLHVIVQYAIIVTLLTHLMTYDYTAWELTGILLSFGISMGGIGITVAHELIHRKNRFLQAAGEVMLLSVIYIHFTIEHVRGHHKKVGTHEDPASAFLGESVYAFFRKSIFFSYISAWKLEAERLRSKGDSLFSLKNTMIIYTLATILYLSAVYALTTPFVFLMYIIASTIAFHLLELVNYIEHYGLERLEKSPGKYVKVAVHHSWNSNTTLSRYFLFELTRHSDHHLHASKEYQILQDINDSPRHPTGYPGMILLALIPPLWKKVMDPKVHEARERYSSLQG